MDFLRKHWYDLGGVFAFIVLAHVLTHRETLTDYQLLMWLNLVTLFFHQLEEYRIAGTFPGMLNATVYKSKLPDRYPLNTNTAFCINVVIGWTLYFLAAAFAEKAVWLGLAAILVSAGNLAAHTVFFNVKGKTIYNAGLATSWLLFAPCVGVFFWLTHIHHLARSADYFIGLPLGILLNAVGIVKLIDWLADKETAYVFEQRNLLPRDRYSP